MPGWWLKLRKRRTLDRDLAREVAFHREMRACDEGAPPFGNETLIREEMREMWTFRWLEAAGQDVRYAVRGMRRNPGFAAAAILSLALGIGASVAIFTVVDNLLLRPLPYRDPNRLVMVWEVNYGRGGRNNVVSPANYLEWKSRNHVFSEMAGLGFRFTTSFGEPGAAAEEVGYQSATPEFFPLLGVNADIGRVFTGDDARPDAKRVVLISQRLWRRRFGADPGAVGRVVHVDGAPATIVGVLPPSFYFLDREIDLWQVLPIDPKRDYRGRIGRYMSCVARLRPGVPVSAARADIAAVGRQLTAEFPRTNTGWGATLEPLRDTLVQNVRTSLYVLMGAVSLLFGIACANVANLLLTRFSARKHELAVRLSIGAGRGRLARQVLTECAVLGCAGGIAGMGIAYVAIRGLLRLAPHELNWSGTLTIDSRVLAFAIALSLVTGLVVGLVSAMAAPNLRPAASARADRRTGASGQRFRWLLVSGEVALGVLLMTGAALLFRTLVQLQAAPYGYDTRNLLTMKVAVSGPDYRSPAARTRLYDDVIARLRSVPGVRDAAAISFIPLHGVPAGTHVVIEGDPEPAPGDGPTAFIRVVTPGYFRLAGIPIVDGRAFEDRDNRREIPYRFIVNQAFARKYFRGSPIGRRISVAMDSDNPFGDIVGVSADISDGPRETGHDPTVYYVHAHLAFPAMMVLVRTSGAPESIILPAQQVVHALEPRATVSETATMQQVLGEVIGRERFSATLLAVFSGFALLLTAIGIYGVLAYTVSERTREIGVRVALGANPGDITGMFAAKALRFTSAGAIAGIAGALALSRFLESLLYETRARDPLSFVAAPAVLIAVALIASLVPSARAAKMNPTDALRVE